jgi:hypothetical protein
MLLNRVPRALVRALVIGMGIALLYWAVTDWSMADAGAYWQAALRLREGEPLYPAVTNVESSEVYRYAPWFAWLTVPFTFLPMAAAGAIWSVVLVVASILAVVPLARRGAWLQAWLFGTVLIGISANGNVHALMILALVWGLEHRSGPLWVALAASLKAVPILFALVYLGRRQWWRFGLTAALTAILVAPFLLYDLSNYVTTAGFAGLLITWPPAYVAVVIGAVGATVYLARGRFGWLAAATAVSLALPRYFVYDITLLLPGAPVSPATNPVPPSSSPASPSRS